MKKSIQLFLFIFIMLVPLLSTAQTHLDSSFLNDFHFRNLGPFRTGSWISGFAVPMVNGKTSPHTFYVATRNGGIWKTINNGITFLPIFDSVSTESIGAVAIAPSDPNIIWAGTGESYNARYSYGGTGMYKSVDAGKTRKSPVVFKIYDVSGKQVVKIDGQNTRGLHHVQWDTRNQKPEKYRVTLISGNDTLEKPAQVEPALVFPVLNYHPKQN